MSLRYEPTSEPLHISVKELLVNRSLQLDAAHLAGGGTKSATMNAW